MILKAETFVNEQVNIKLNFDDYIPLCVEFCGHENYSKLYWRIGDGMKNMLEISVNKESKTLSSITLVNISKSSVFETKNNLKEILKNSSNIPVFCLDIWKDNDDFFSNRFCDNFDLSIKVFLYCDSIMITIGVPEGEISFAKYSDRFYLGLNPDKSVSIIFLKNISSKEIEKFLNCVS